MTTFKLKNEKVKNSDIEQSATQYLFNILTITPLIALTLLMTFYLLVTLEVGHIPTYSNPDPSYSIFGFLQIPVILGIIGAMATIPLYLLYIALHFMKKIAITSVGVKILVYILPIIVFLLINAYSPVMVWLMD